MSLLGSTFNFVKQLSNGPLGSIALGAVGNLLSPKPTPVAVLQTPYQGTNTIQEYGASTLNWGGGSTTKPSIKIDSGGSESMPTWVKPLAIGAGILVALGILWKLFFTKKRK